MFLIIFNINKFIILFNDGKATGSGDRLGLRICKVTINLKNTKCLVRNKTLGTCRNQKISPIWWYCVIKHRLKSYFMWEYIWKKIIYLCCFYFFFVFALFYYRMTYSVFLVFHLILQSSDTEESKTPLNVLLIKLFKNSLLPLKQEHWYKPVCCSCTIARPAVMEHFSTLNLSNSDQSD